MKKLLCVSMVLALVLGLGLVYAAQFELTYVEKDNTTTIGIFNAVGGATVNQWNWNCGEQNVLVYQNSGNAASMSGAKAETEGGNGNDATSGFVSAVGGGFLGGANANSNSNGGGNSGNAGAISGALAITGNVLLVKQDATQVAKSESTADVINTVIAKINRVNRAKLNIENSYNETVPETVPQD